MIVGFSRNPTGRFSVRLVAALTASLVAFGGAGGARAFDFFGLWGSDDKPPAASRNAISYAVTIDVVGTSSSVKNAVRDTSSLYRLRDDPPPDGDALARRARSDFGPILDALWGAGYYNATVVIAIGATSLTIGSGEAAAFARAAESYRNRAPAPVAIRVDPGPMFHLNAIHILGAGGADITAMLPDRVRGLKPGDDATASSLRAAQARIIDYFRNQGRPLAKGLAIAPVVDHARETMDLTISVEPGPIAPFGEATLHGPHRFDPAIARSFLYIEPGDPYSPRAVADARESLRQIPAVGGVRITEAKSLDAYGRLPYTVDIEDRAKYAIGASAKYSTTNGPAGQVYVEDRNLFGGAERLRLQADVFYAPPWYVTSQSVRDLTMSDIGWRLSASFLKPALWGTRNDLLVDALGERMSTSGAGFLGYEVEDADVTAQIRHRFTQTFWFQMGVEAQTGVSEDALGRINYTLVGVPASVNYDTTDNKLDPTRGVRINAGVSAFPTFFGSTLNLAQGKVRASAYYSLDSDSRFVLAGRVGLGASGGAGLADIPSNWRFYAGGGGSVRGYAFNSLGPRGPYDAIVGGRSLFEASAELRIRVTDTIGIVPFFDAGNAFDGTLPNFSAPLYYSAGIGLRYYTAIGPIRADIAFPLERPHDTGPVALYISIGQSF